MEYEEIRKEDEVDEFALLWKDFKEYQILFFFGCVGSSLWHGGLFPVAQHRLQSTRAQELWCMGFVDPVARGISVPQPGIEPASPASEGRFLTTGPPG